MCLDAVFNQVQRLGGVGKDQYSIASLVELVQTVV